MRHGFGWTSGVNQNSSIAFGSDDANTASTTNNNTFRRGSNAYCITHVTSGTLSVQAKLKQFTATGFELTYDNNNTSTYTIHYFAIGGTDITNAKAGMFTPNTTTGTQNVNDPAFSPDLVMFMGINHTDIPTTGTSTPHALWFLGAGKNTTQRWATSGISREVTASNTDTARLQRVDKCIVQFAEGSTTAIDMEADYSGPITNGFAINITDAPAQANPIFYLAIKGGSWNLGNFVHPTVVGTQAITGVGFPVKGLFFTSHRGSAGNAIQRNHAFMWGAASGTGATGPYSSVFGDDNDAVPITITGRGTQTASPIKLVQSQNDGTTDTWLTNAEATISSFDTTVGFTLNWTTLSSATAQRQILFLAAGDTIDIGADLKKFAAKDTVNITETVRRFSDKRRNVKDGDVHIIETTARFLGKVRFSEPTTATTVTGGFTSTGFLSSGYEIQTTIGADLFVPADFEAADFTFSSTAFEGEGVTIRERTHYIKTLTQEYVTAANFVFYYSGGTTIDAATNTLSRGGARSNNSIASNALNAAWDDIATIEASGGEVEHRCFYLVNNHPTLTAYNVKMWIKTNLTRGEIKIGRGTSAVNGTEQGPLSTEESAPAGVEFTTAVDEDSAITLGDIPPGQSVAFWQRREMFPNTLALINNRVNLGLSHYSSHV